MMMVEREIEFAYQIILDNAGHNLLPNLVTDRHYHNSGPVKKNFLTKKKEQSVFREKKIIVFFFNKKGELRAVFFRKKNCNEFMHCMYYVKKNGSALIKI